MEKRNIWQWRLYVITDETYSRGRTHEQVAEAAIRGGADVLQLRDKQASSRKLYVQGLKLRELTRQAGIPFIVNDRVDIALAVEADGVHVGQQDLPATVARRLIGPDRILGVSASSLEEALQAEKDGADYIGLGPIFEARGTKPDAGEPQGLDLIRQVRQHVSLPIVAIGGISSVNVQEVILAGADAVAAISAIVTAEDIARRVQELRQLIEQAHQKRGG